MRNICLRFLSSVLLGPDWCLSKNCFFFFSASNLENELDVGRPAAGDLVGDVACCRLCGDLKTRRKHDFQAL